jgi:LuxR family maltose regulon positive regulatory protein
MEADMARSFLTGLLHRPQEAAAWLRDGPPDAFSRRLFTQAIPFAQVCRARCLLLNRKPEVLLNENAAALGFAAALHSTPALVYGHIHAAAAWAMQGEGKEAAFEFRKALDLALPDALYMPFAENYRLIGPFLTKALFGKERKEDLSRIKVLAKQMKTGRETILQATQPPTTPALLTGRELEVAHLVVEGLSNQNIAEKLNIKDSTVKAHLTRIFQKTEIQSRSGLHKIFQ